ncbi:flagellar hook-length control protein FliK [Aliarcobacter cibarius]|uniref:Flagellar hook-length control protein FliK n=1 Tax=Aliarcobacter cibarius TaxID=255507 RepID=A0ABY2V9S1_9BACT|nr:flagellar hook-length control protein FliK [Aliarcobacter cibarius]TLS98954.1 flagellar hook-length control protein FliK [Aliarcobacter cibarius]TLS99870.1 flagellar hook-length control protein FliK [Aliarcobacter cibarius]
MQAIDIFTPEGSSLESGTSLLGGQKEEKNGPSLFDSILKSSIDSKNLNSTGEEVISDSLKVANTMENNLTTTSGMGSLLDKLIISAKETISQNGAETISNEISSDQLDNVDLKDKTKFVDTLKNIIQTNSTVSVDESVIESEVNVVEAETSTSLLDKLVSDAKKDIFDSDVVKTNSIEATSNQNVESDVKVVEMGTSISLLDRLVSDVKKDILDSDTVKINSTIPMEELSSSLIESEVKLVEESTPTSLLDKLISDAKNKIIEDKNNLKEQNIKNVETSVVKNLTEELVVTNISESNITLDESNNIIKSENSDIENVFINNLSKEIIGGLENKNPENNDLEATLIEKAVDKPKSLMDALIQNSVKKQEEFLAKNSDLTNVDVKQKEIVSSIYLSEQKNQLNTQLNFNKSEALNLLKDGASLDDIKKSASILDLGLEEVDVEKALSLDDVIKKNSLRDLNDRKQILDTLLNEKNIRSVDVKNLITKSVEASSALLENKLNFVEDSVLNVNSPLSFNIQTKIIGARQQMSNMMSDIAKQMYENYRPPVTVFRINLNPENLGSIAIMMKSEKNSDVSISMSVSSQATLDALVENQNLLRNSLVKTFEENTKFNLDFSSQERNQNNQGQQKQEDHKNQDEYIDTTTILKLQEENKEIDDKFDYM